MSAPVHHLTVTGDSSAVVAASAWTRSLGQQLQLLPGDVFRLDLCVSELVTNIASYGYANGGDRTIELRAETTGDGDGIRVEVIDSGKPFDPMAAPPPTPAAVTSDVRVGGLGIHLVRSLADECRYDRSGLRNVFTLVIKRSTAAANAGVDGPIGRGIERRCVSAAPSFPLTRSDGTIVWREERSRQERRLLGFISACNVFRHVPYRLLEELLASCPVRSFADGEILLRPGDQNHHVVLVLQGRLRIHLGSHDSADYTEIAAGECAGEMSVIDGKPASAYVIADSGCRLILIDGPTFLTRILPIPGVARNLVSTLSERMRYSNDRIIERMKASLELEGLQRELRFAQQVQSSMVPERMTLAPARTEVQCVGYMRAARQVGGDFYDAFYIDANRLVVVIGDVCGKGMPAALFMSRALTLLRSEAMHPTRHAQRHHMLDLVERTNRQLCQGNTSTYFASIFAAVLDVSTGLLTWVNAGHTPPLLARGSSEFRFLTEPRNVVAGFTPEAAYTVAETALPPGSVLLLYTDGVTEAEDANGGMFGEERLLHLVNHTARRDPATVIQATADAVERFVQAHTQSDDLTMLALRYNPEGMTM